MKNETYTYAEAVEMMNKRNERKAEPKKRTFTDWAAENEPLVIFGSAAVYCVFFFSFLAL